MQPRSVVLIVEDDEDVVRVLGLMLRARGLGFVSAPTVASARQLLRDIRPDAVLLDLSLPDGDGLELLDDIEAEFAIPVVVITGSDRDVGTYGHPLLIDWVGKPFEEGRIEEALRLALTTRQDALVLVVEDDPSAREIIVQMLASIGVECLEASDGATAVEIVRDAQPDLVVLDVGLPALDGFSVVAELREGANHDTPLVVYSGRDLSAADREELTLGATRHLTKLRASETEFLDAVLELLGRALPGKA